MSNSGMIRPLGVARAESSAPRAPEPGPEPELRELTAPSREPHPFEPHPFEPLWREVLGSRLRALRGEREETLAQTAERAGISPQYLSEVERGRKEASSEMIAALAGALGVTVADLMADTAEDLRRAATTVITLTAVTSRTVGFGRATGGPGAGAEMTSLAGPGLARSSQRPSGPVALAAAA